MAKKKLERFAEIATFPNVIQAPVYIGLGDHPIRGKWGAEMFGNEKAIILELGCGRGEYTLSLGTKYPDKNFIGIDIKGNRLWRGSKTAFETGMKNVAFLRIQIEQIEHFFSEGEIDEIWITFPDPQLKDRNEPKRLTSPQFLARYRKIMGEKGSLHLKTDNHQLFEYTLGTIGSLGLRLLKKIEDIHQNIETEEVLKVLTTYEKIFMRQGLPIYYLHFAF